MIPINIRFFSKKLIIFLIIVTSVISIIYIIVFIYFEKKVMDEFKKGPDLHYITEAETIRILDSIKIGLDRYYVRSHKYPNVDGKYFFDSIKSLVGDLSPYVYNDSIYSGRVISKPGYSIKYPEYLYKSNSFIGIGIYEEYIVYRKGNNKYIIYSVGKNLKDDNGKGDDILPK